MALWTPAALAAPIWVDDESTITLDGSSRVQDWANKGSIGGTFSQATGSVRPTVVGQAVRFNGTSQFLLGPSAARAITRNVGGLWAFAVYTKRTADTSGSPYRVVFGFSVGTSGSSRFDLHATAGANYNRPTMGVRRLDADSWSSLTAATARTVSPVMAATQMQHSSGAGAIYLDGVLSASGAAITSSGNTSNTDSFVNVTLGCAWITNTAAGYFADVDLYALVIGTGTLGQDDRKRLEGWAAHRYDLAANLPDDHPYKAAPPSDAQFAGSAALGSVSAAGAASVLVGATGAVVLEGATGTGVIAVDDGANPGDAVFAGAAVLQDAAAASGAVVGVGAASAVLLGDAAGGGAASVLVSAAGAAALDEAQGAGAAQVHVGAAGGAVLDDLAGAGALSLGGFFAGAAVLDDAVGDGWAVAPVAAQSGAVLADVDAAAVTSVIVAGQGGAVLGDAESVGAATAPASLAGAAALDNAQGLASAVAPIHAWASQAMDGVVSLAYASTPLYFSGLALLEDAVCSAAGRVGERRFESDLSVVTAPTRIYAVSAPLRVDVGTTTEHFAATTRVQSVFVAPV